MKNQKRFLILLLFVGVLVAACQKEATDTTTSTPSSDVASSTDNSTAENLFTDLFKVVDEGAKQTTQLNKKGGSVLDTCATLTVEILDSISGWPIRLTIDYGTGCTSSIDGRTRAGIVVAEFTGRYKDAGTVITITPQNYSVNNYKVEGTKTITNNGLNVDNNLTFTVDVAGGKITDPSGNVSTWASTRTNEWIDGDSTPWPNICDDIYMISGSANGINRNGLAYTVLITKDLRKEICCKHITEGTIEVTPSGLTKRIIDYGSGTCDGLITVSVGTFSFNVVLP
jgi:hypothetical protein